MAKKDAPKTESESQIPAQTIEIPAMPVTVNMQYIKDLSFENPNPLASFQESSDQPEITLTIDVNGTNVSENTYEVTLHLMATAKRAEQKLFVVELEYAGIFTFGANVPKEAVHPLLMIECPRLLFPYARTIVANATREGGFPSLALNPIDFLELYRRQYESNDTTSETDKVKNAKSGS